MYAHAQRRAFRPTSNHPTIHTTSHYDFSASSGQGISYDASAAPAIRSTPLPIPKTSSSSLAAALDPAPEPDCNRSSVPPSQLIGRAGEQFDPAAFANFCAGPGAGDMAFEEIRSGRFARADSRQITVPSASSQHQTYQTGNTQSQSLSQFAYAQPDMLLSSSSYAQPHQPSAYTRSDDPQWPCRPLDMGFSGYPTSLSHPSASSTISSSSEYSIFPNDFAFAAANSSERPLDVYTNSVAVEEWSYAQSDNSFHASEGMYIDFNHTAAAVSDGSWFGPSVNPQGGMSSTETNTPFFESSITQQQPESDSTSEGQGSSRLSEADAGFSTLNEDQALQDAQPSPDTFEDRRIPNSRKHYQPSTSRADELMPQPDPLQQPSAHRSHSVQSSFQATNGLQRGSEVRQLQGHNVLMPPPPLPPRARTSAEERPGSSSRSSHEGCPRRHTVAAPPSRGSVDEGRDPSPASSLATTSARPSSAAPRSSGSSSLRGQGGEASPTTPKLATLNLNDAQWAQAQEHHRRALKETYNLVHGREPPGEMRIEQTSALERSIKNDAVLFASRSSSEEKRPQIDRTGMDGEAGQEPAHGELPSASPDEINEEEPFDHVPATWIQARSPFETGQRPVGASAHPDPSNPVSPVSPGSIDGLNTPGANSLRHPRMKFAYETPANPDAISPSMKTILTVIRHDGHLSSHVSGLGGPFVQAYDGRSYLTDDSEPDPIHLPPCPPGARSGDHPSLDTILPHPLAKRGQTWHELVNPRKSRALEKCPDQQQDIDGPDCDSPDKNEGTEPADGAGGQAVLKKLEEEGVKEEEQGEGWGFIEGGSHGPSMALPEKDKSVVGPKQTPRLKLSTEKKTPPKMACHFCRNRKIACGASKCGDPTICNQCERRNIRCIFPTMSRRGMRTKTPRSAHTVDGTDEADKDSTDHDGASEQTGHRRANEGSSNSKKTSKSKRPYEKGYKEKEPAKGKGRGRGSRKAESPIEQKDDSTTVVDASPDVDHMNQEPFEGMQDVRPSGHDDPLASLAAEIQWPRQDATSTGGPSMPFDPATAATFPAPSSLSTSSLSGALHFPSSTFESSFSASIPGDTYTLQVDPSIGPFTTSPLQRRGQSSTMQP